MYSFEALCSKLLCLAAFATCSASILRPSTLLHKRLLSNIPDSQHISFEALRLGWFRPDPNLRPFAADSASTLRRELFSQDFYYNGVPIYFMDYRRGGFPLPKLQIAYKDYGKFHALGRHLADERTLTVSRPSASLEGRPLVRPADAEVHSYALQARSIRQKYGDTAALAAFGYDLRHAPPIRQFGMTFEPSPVKWKKVWRSRSLPNDMLIGEARDLLAEGRHARFSTSDGRSSLGIRLLANGEKEVRELATTTPVFHV